MPIDSIVAAGSAAAPVSARPGASASTGFADLVGRLVEGLEESSADANTAVDAMVHKTGDVHDAMIALQRSELALQLAVQVRNKFVQAYQDIMRMPI